MFGSSATIVARYCAAWRCTLVRVPHLKNGLVLDRYNIDAVAFLE
jgi:hypothetical protein